MAPRLPCLYAAMKHQKTDSEGNAVDIRKRLETNPWAYVISVVIAAGGIVAGVMHYIDDQSEKSLENRISLLSDQNTSFKDQIASLKSVTRTIGSEAVERS